MGQRRRDRVPIAPVDPGLSKRSGKATTGQSAPLHGRSTLFGKGAIVDIPQIRHPLRQFGEPVVRSVRTEIIAEQIRAGESIDAIVDIYELDRKQVEAAVRHELIRRSPEDLAA